MHGVTNRLVGGPVMLSRSISCPLAEGQIAVETQGTLPGTDKPT